MTSLFIIAREDTKKIRLGPEVDVCWHCLTVWKHRVSPCPVNAFRSGDKQFFGVTAPEAEGSGGTARVIAGLITALLRPVVFRFCWGALRLAFAV